MIISKFRASISIQICTNRMLKIEACVLSDEEGKRKREEGRISCVELVGEMRWKEQCCHHEWITGANQTKINKQSENNLTLVK